MLPVPRGKRPPAPLCTPDGAECGGLAVDAAQQTRHTKVGDLPRVERTAKRCVRRPYMRSWRVLTAAPQARRRATPWHAQLICTHAHLCMESSRVVPVCHQQHIAARQVAVDHGAGVEEGQGGSNVLRQRGCGEAARGGGHRAGRAGGAGHGRHRGLLPPRTAAYPLWASITQQCIHLRRSQQGARVERRALGRALSQPAAVDGVVQGAAVAVLWKKQKGAGRRYWRGGRGG